MIVAKDTQIESAQRRVPHSDTLFYIRDACCPKVHAISVRLHPVRFARVGSDLESKSGVAVPIVLK